MSDQMIAPLIFGAFLDEVCALSKESDTLQHYTPHDISHIQGVEQSIKRLLETQIDQNRIPTPLERLLLSFCAWSHDLGMIESVAIEFAQKHRTVNSTKEHKTPEQLRKNHDLASAYYLQKVAPELLKKILKNLQDSPDDPAHDSEKGKEHYRSRIRSAAQKINFCTETISDIRIDDFLEKMQDRSFNNYFSAQNSNLIHTVNLISRYHRRSENLSNCPKERRLFEQPVRTQFLAALFRLADALHIDRTRFSESNFDLSRALPQFSEENRMHWIKSAIISSIRVDDRTNTVHIQADLPDTTNSQSGAREMLNFVRSDIEDDLLSVSGILLDHGFPPLLGVSYEIHQIPEIDYANDIRSALDSILAAASPNTSKLANIAIGSISKLLESHSQEGAKNPESSLENSLAGQIRAIAKQLEERPCHEALRKIHDLLSSIFHIWKTNRGQYTQPFQNARMSRAELLWTWLECACHTFSEQRKKNANFRLSPNDQDILEPYSDIVLYGYSRQVIQLLKSHFSVKRRKRQNIHVLECRTKTLYSHSGNILYLDGLRFAERISSEVAYSGDLSIEPDMALGHIIVEAKKIENGEDTLIKEKRRRGRVAVIMGTNAVYSDGTFRHSMGHLAVAAIAKSDDWAKYCDVIVTTDSMKIGKTPIPSSKERNPGTWLTPDREVLRRIERQDIRLHNWQEDMIPAKHIDMLIILDHRKIINMNTGDAEAINRGIEDSSFDAHDMFAANIQRKILAALIRRNSSHFSEISNEIAHVLKVQTSPNNDDIANWLIAEYYLNSKENGFGPGSYSEHLDPPTARDISQILASHFQEIKLAIDEIWDSGDPSCADLVERMEREVRKRHVPSSADLSKFTQIG